MSLINDAMKTAQREKAGRAQSDKDQQSLVDGFFPYVSTGPARSRSRLVPSLVIGASALALIALVGWFAFTSFDKPAADVKPRVVIPQRAVNRPPVSRDTGASRTDIRASTTPPASSPATSSATAPTLAPITRAAEHAQVPVQPSPRVVSAAPQSDARIADTRSAPSDTAIAPTITEVRRTPVVPVQPPRPRIDYEGQATALFNAGDLVGARDKFLLATRNAPTARVWTNYGVTLQKLGDMTGAAAAYQSAIGVDANYLEAWLYQGRLATLLGEVARAVPLFHRARAINPRNADVNVELAYLEYEAKNFTESRRFAEDALRSDASNARAHWFLAVSTDQLKDFETATREYAAYLQSIGPAARDQAANVGFARQRLTELRGKP